jgi:hypothetical protein
VQGCCAGDDGAGDDGAGDDGAGDPEGDDPEGDDPEDDDPEDDDPEDGEGVFDGGEVGAAGGPARCNAVSTREESPAPANAWVAALSDALAAVTARTPTEYARRLPERAALANAVNALDSFRSAVTSAATCAL